MNKSKTIIAIICTAIMLVMTGTTAFAEGPSRHEIELKKIQSFLGLMDNYLNVAQKWVKMVSDRETTIYLVTERITEIYEKKGNKGDAIPELRKILARYEDNPAVRNLIHFKIAEIYKKTGHGSKALEELNTIIESDRKP